MLREKGSTHHCVLGKWRKGVVSPGMRTPEPGKGKEINYFFILITSRIECSFQNIFIFAQ